MPNRRRAEERLLGVEEVHEQDGVASVVSHADRHLVPVQEHAEEKVDDAVGQEEDGDRLRHRLVDGSDAAAFVQAAREVDASEGHHTRGRHRHDPRFAAVALTEGRREEQI